jgi:hypothetical protein
MPDNSNLFSGFSFGDEEENTDSIFGGFTFGEDTESTVVDDFSDLPQVTYKDVDLPEKKAIIAINF